MAKKTFLQGLSSELEHSAALHTHNGLRLSKVLYESPAKFRVNVLNSEFFHDDDADYMQRLAKDIQERGILVPIVAKPDGTLLAGHNRLRIAQEQKIALVPVQYVEQVLSPEEEKKFVINDNLLRRHLSQQQRLTLYRALYPNFDERITQRSHHRPAKTPEMQITLQKVDNVHLPLSDATNGNHAPLTAAIIARDTGQKKTAVQKQLQRLHNDIQTKQKAPIINTAQLSSAQVSKTFQKRLQALQTVLDSAEEDTRKQMLKELKRFVKSLS